MPCILLNSESNIKKRGVLRALPPITELQNTHIPSTILGHISRALSKGGFLSVTMVICVYGFASEEYVM